MYPMLSARTQFIWKTVSWLLSLVMCVAVILYAQDKYGGCTDPGTGHVYRAGASCYYVDAAYNKLHHTIVTSISDDSLGCDINLGNSRTGVRVGMGLILAIALLAGITALLVHNKMGKLTQTASFETGDVAISVFKGILLTFVLIVLVYTFHTFNTITACVESDGADMNRGRQSVIEGLLATAVVLFSLPVVWSFALDASSGARNSLADTFNGEPLRSRRFAPNSLLRIIWLGVKCAVYFFTGIAVLVLAYNSTHGGNDHEEIINTDVPFWAYCLLSVFLICQGVLTPIYWAGVLKATDRWNAAKIFRGLFFDYWPVLNFIAISVILYGLSTAGIKNDYSNLVADATISTRHEEYIRLIATRDWAFWLTIVCIVEHFFIEAIEHVQAFHSKK